MSRDCIYHKNYIKHYGVVFTYYHADKVFTLKVNMIITDVNAGLGCQMFQYAVAKNISVKTGADFKLWISYFINQTYDKDYVIKSGVVCWYQLDAFNIKAHIAHQKDFDNFKKSNGQFFFDKGPAFFMQEIFQCSDSYLYGNWFNEKYFIDIAQQIREDFTLRLPLYDDEKKILEKIENCNSIGVHIRLDSATRKDYPKHVKRTVYGKNYYYKALDIMAKKIDNPHFFIFSDEANLAANNFQIKYPHTFVNIASIKNILRTVEAGQHDYRELWLLRSCKHQIITSSNFGWWAAWLNPNLNKIICAPKYVNMPGDEWRVVMPDSWLQIGYSEDDIHDYC